MNPTTNSADAGGMPVESAAKRRKTGPPLDTSDTLDPVEKLLSFANIHNDILYSLDQESVQDDSDSDYEEDSDASASPSNITVNFTDMLQENLRHYYSNCKRGPLDLYTANSSFSVLNKPAPKPKAPVTTPVRQDVPFFKAVNFNPNPKSSAYTFDEYLAYDDDEPESTSESDSDQASPETPTSAHPSPVPANLKMCFHYRQFNNNLNLSSQLPAGPQEVLQCLNKRSILSGRASEMVSSGTFMINDFFL